MRHRKRTSTSQLNAGIPAEKTSAHVTPELNRQSQPEQVVATGSYGGFVVSACAHVAFALYLLWAFMPDSIISAVGISWYPSRDWALLLPSWLTMLVVTVYLGYAALNIYDTPSMDSPAHVTDAFALVQDSPDSSTAHPLVANSPRHIGPDSIPALYDMPLAVYNRFAFEDQDVP